LILTQLERRTLAENFRAGLPALGAVIGGSVAKGAKVKAAMEVVDTQAKRLLDLTLPYLNKGAIIEAASSPLTEEVVSDLRQFMEEAKNNKETEH